MPLSTHHIKNVPASPVHPNRHSDISGDHTPSGQARAPKAVNRVLAGAVCMRRSLMKVVCSSFKLYMHTAGSFASEVQGTSIFPRQPGRDAGGLTHGGWRAGGRSHDDVRQGAEHLLVRAREELVAEPGGGRSST